LTGQGTGDLVAALRAELAAIEPARRCDRVAERAGLGPAAQGRARTPLIGRLAVRLDDAVADTEFNWDGAAEHCRTAFLRGAFLARGSLSITPTGTHLELIVDAGLMTSTRVKPLLVEANEITAMLVASRKTAVARGR